MRSKSYHNSIAALVITIVLVLLSGCKKGEKGEEVLFTSAEPVTDIEGNTYNAIKIGTQIWMVENLKTTKYNDGDSIPNVITDTIWAGLLTGAYCNYNNSDVYGNTYGRLYNWYAVNTRKLCPSGWHVPTSTEWKTLIKTIGNEDFGLKFKATNGWSNGKNGTNGSGFAGLPGGARNAQYYALFLGIGEWANWWCLDQGSEADLDSDRGLAIYGYLVFSQTGESVRCLKN